MRNCFDSCVETPYAESRVDRTSLSLLGSVSSLVCFSFFFLGARGGGVCPLRRGGRKTVEDEHGGDYCLLSLSFCVLVVQRV